MKLRRTETIVLIAMAIIMCLTLVGAGGIVWYVTSRPAIPVVTAVAIVASIPTAVVQPTNISSFPATWTPVPTMTPEPTATPKPPTDAPTQTPEAAKTLTPTPTVTAISTKLVPSPAAVTTNPSALSAIDNGDGDGNYTIYWAEQPSRLAVTYLLQEATNAAFTMGVRDVCTASQQNCDVSGKAEGVYYYRVRGQNSRGFGDWSNVQLATVLPPPPTPTPDTRPSSPTPDTRPSSPTPATGISSCHPTLEGVSRSGSQTTYRWYNTGTAADVLVHQQYICPTFTGSEAYRMGVPPGSSVRSGYYARTYCHLGSTTFLIMGCD